jgi:hypothetical protein
VDEHSQRQRSLNMPQSEKQGPPQQQLCFIGQSHTEVFKEIAIARRNEIVVGVSMLYQLCHTTGAACSYRGGFDSDHDGGMRKHTGFM